MDSDGYYWFDSPTMEYGIEEDEPEDDQEESQTESPSLPSLPLSLQEQLACPAITNSQRNQAMSMKEIDSKLNNLRRENFDLKLRLFYEKQNKGVRRSDGDSFIEKDYDKYEKTLEEYKNPLEAKDRQLNLMKNRLEENVKDKGFELNILRTEREPFASDLQVTTSICKSFMSHLYDVRDFWARHLKEKGIQQKENFIDSVNYWLNSSEDLLNSASVLISDVHDLLKERNVNKTQQSLDDQAKIPIVTSDRRNLLKGSMVNKTQKPLDKQVKIPIIIFPGIASNALFRSSTDICGLFDYRVWINGLFLLNGTRNCWAKRMKLKYFPDNNTVADNINPIYVADMGGTSTMTDLTIGFPIKVTQPYKFLVNRLVAAGFRIRETIFGIPYDWRRAVVDAPYYYYQNVYDEISGIVTTNSVKKVNLVCHSHGCINMAAFLIRQGKSWSQANINAIITLGAPWAGSVKCLKAFLSGDNFDLSYLDIDMMKEIQQTLTSLVHLFPSPKVFKDKIFEFKTDAKEVKLSANELERILKESLINPEIMRDRRNITDYFDRLLETTAGIKKYCLYSVGRTNTTQKLIYEGAVSSSTLRPEYGNGDDSVNEISLKYCDGKTDVESHPYSNVTHDGMLENIPIIRFIIDKSIVKV